MKTIVLVHRAINLSKNFNTKDEVSYNNSSKITKLP